MNTAPRTVALIQARMASTRLPGKVLTDLAGRPVLDWVVKAAQAIPGIDAVAVATSDKASDDSVAEWCKQNGIACHRGPEDDVLERFRLAAEAEKADVILRLTADCPLLDPSVCAQVLALRARTGADYASNVDPATWPDGLDCEAFTRTALETAAREAVLASEREHVTPFIRKRRARFKVEALVCPVPGLERERWTLDDPQDLAFLSEVVRSVPDGKPPAFTEVLALLDRSPELRAINADSGRNAGYTKSLKADDSAPLRSYAASGRLLERAERTIPLGTQTFSKSHIQYPKGAAPLFLSHGQGGRVFDVDGNEYVDMVCGLLPVVLGYRDPDIDAALRSQINNAGISFSLATALESELAERLVELIPCAEKVRFGKNGSDATSACIRLARAFTGRERIAVCGYHGWQDWYIGATARNKGVPQAVRDLTHVLPYNDLAAADRLFSAHKGEFAALIMEPMNAVDPKLGYLAELKELTHKHGALFVFDEVITGFRFALGGAQTLFGVTPDLAAFGKAMGNGMPIAAVVGRADVMHEMEEVFYSGTFGGEALSLAAAIATIDKMRAEPVIETLWKTGSRLADGARTLIAQHGLSEVIRFVGAPPWTLLAVDDHKTARKEAIKTLLIAEMARRGVLILASHNVCYAHNEADIAQVLAAYDGALATVAGELATGSLESRLPYPAIEPIFKVR